jgi:NAD(P)-dependent dehydrogenase (short-subunit alcohol dehydrogenase family)
VKDLFSIAGKVALVTGGSRGIGLMIARGYVAAGAKVYISARKAEACERAAAELSREGTCIALPADLSTEAGARALAEDVARRERALHILVNNAGANWGAPLAEYPDSAWDKVLALNVKGVFHLTRACVALLERAARPGDPARVVNIGSIDGLRVPVLETYAYSASKAAVHHLTRALAVRLAPRITVNAVAPGPFESKMMAETLRRFGDAIVASCPLGRIGEPEDMAGVAIYLASRAGAYLTGTVIPVDGGITTRPA